MSEPRPQLGERRQDCNDTGGRQKEYGEEKLRTPLVPPKTNPECREDGSI